MKAILDAASFERLWRELDQREQSEPDSDLWHTTLWLECSAEFVDIGLVDALGVPDPGVDIEIVQFDCPRCGQRHESLRFR
jgi:hypothetical protein